MPQQEAPKSQQEPFDTAMQQKNWLALKAYFDRQIESGTFSAKQLKAALRAGARLEELDLSELPEGSLDGQRFEGGVLDRCRLPSMSDTAFKGVSLKEAEFRDASLHKVSFEDCAMKKSFFSGCKLQQASFRGDSSLQEAKFYLSDITDSRFAAASLAGTKFFDLKIEKSNFDRQSMLGSSIVSVAITESSFHEADLRACDIVLSSSDEQTSWRGAKLSGFERMPETLGLLDRGAVRTPIGQSRAAVPPEAWRNYSARAGNPIALLRSQLEEFARARSESGAPYEAINGKGSKIVHIEQIRDSPSASSFRHSPHSRAVRNRMLSTSQSGGLATAADYELVDLANDARLRPRLLGFGHDDVALLKEAVLDEASQHSEALGAQLKKLAEAQEQNPQSRADVVVVSMGISPARLYMQVQQLLDPALRPALCAAVYAEAKSAVERKQAIVDFVDALVLDEKGRLQAEVNPEYDGQLEKLWNQGTLVVMSAGNDRMLKTTFEHETPEGALKYRGSPELNLMVRPRVLSVASTESNATANTLDDDLISAFSSRGDGQQHPGMSAVGEAVLVGYDIVDGTSFSAPFVASTVALMRQLAPQTDAATIREALLESSFDNPEYAPQEEGRGQLQVLEALKRIVAKDQP